MKSRIQFRFRLSAMATLPTPPMSRSRRAETKIAGAMIGRAAMSSPWIFHQIKDYLATGVVPPSPEPLEKWALIQQHCRLAVAEWGAEDPAMRSHARATDGLFERSRREQKLAREISARLDFAEVEANCRRHLSEHESVALRAAGDLEALVS